MGSDNLPELLAAYAVQLPALAVFVAGLGFVLARRRRYPRAAQPAAVGLAVLLADAAAGPALTHELPRALITRGWHIADIGGVVQGVAAARSAALAAGVVLLLMAVFAGRSRESTGDQL